MIWIAIGALWALFTENLHLALFVLTGAVLWIALDIRDAMQRPGR